MCTQISAFSYIQHCVLSSKLAQIVRQADWFLCTGNGSQKTQDSTLTDGDSGRDLVHNFIWSYVRVIVESIG